MLVSVEVNNVNEVDNRDILYKIAASIASARRIVAVTGAGISVSAGIPDFRSADGLYARVLSSPATDASVKSAKGKDFFDASFFHNPSTRPLFNKFVAELRNMCTAGRPTPTHGFLKDLASDGRLQRWYTQNIDGFEKATGLMTNTCSEAANSNKKVPLVVSLHGTLDRLSCTLCKDLVEFNEDHKRSFLRGESPECSKCAAFSAERQANGRRAVKGGIMRPDIVLYNEQHPQGDIIADFLTRDMSKRPNILLVMGTSLKVVGLKKMVKDLARAVRQQPDGLVIFINKTAAPRSEWKTVFDYELLGECDHWIKHIREFSITTPANVINSPRRFLPPITPLSSPKPSVNIELSKKDGRIDKIFKTVRKANAIASDVKKKRIPANDENDGRREEGNKTQNTIAPSKPRPSRTANKSTVS
jgi:NAD-dependent histone deacetylase SIR2